MTQATDASNLVTRIFASNRRKQPGYLRLLDGANPADDEDTLIVVFYTKLKESKWPDLYVAIDKMPYTPIGKVDRKQLRVMAESALKNAAS